MPSDETFMARAIELARSAPFTSPNPRVGAVVVRGDSILSEGAHRGAGSAHAEAVALEGVDASGATLYVNLEPCSHTGRTPPCAPMVVAAQVARVVVANEDPDARVSGAGLELLRGAGIEVLTGVLAAEGEWLNAPFFHHHRTGRAYLTLKLALSLDGRLAAPDRSSRWITGDRARTRTHARRLEADVVMVGRCVWRNRATGKIVETDPIPAADYYALAGVFMSGRWVTNTLDTPERNRDNVARLRRLKRELLARPVAGVGVLVVSCAPKRLDPWHAELTQGIAVARYLWRNEAEARAGGVSSLFSVVGYLIGFSFFATAAIAHLAHSTPPEWLFSTTDFNSYVTVSTADGAPQRVNGRMAASKSPGLGIKPKMGVLGKPVVVVG